MVGNWYDIGKFAGFILILYTYQFSFSSLKRTEVLKHIRNDFSMFSSQIFVSLQLYAPVVFISFLEVI